MSNLGDKDMLPERETVARFSAALRLALHDKKLEQHDKIVFYFDADVVVRMILGFQQFRYESGSRIVLDQRALLLRALLSFGYLGSVHLLRPHALELDEALRGKPAFNTELGRDEYRRELTSFLEQWHAQELFSHLKSLIENSPEREAVGLFLEHLQRVGPESFIPIELANGSWQQRLARFGRKRLINFDSAGGDVRMILRDPLLIEFREAISTARRRRTKKYLSLSILRDAMALLVLHRLIADKQQGKDVPYVRFYTETDALKEAWISNDRLRALLSYSNPHNTEDLEYLRALLSYSTPHISGDLTYLGEESFVGRTADYFILRASFEALSFQDLKVRKLGDGATVRLEALEAVSRELDKLPHNGADAEFLVSHRVGDQPLKFYVDQFKSLSFIRSIWVRYDPPDQLEEFVKGIKEVWAFAQEGETAEAIRQRIREEIVGVQRELHDKVKSLRSYYEILRSIQGSSNRILRGKVELYNVPDPMRDLGLIRWGLILSLKGEERFRNLMVPLIAKEEDEWWHGCHDFAAAIRDVGVDPEECTIVCAILWVLNEFAIIEDVVDGFEAAAKSVPCGLILMRAAAQLRGRALDVPTKATILESLIERLKALSKENRPKYLLGVGYLLFHAWNAEVRGRMPSEQDTTIRGWVELSFELGEEGARLLKPSTLAWAFAINHCAYVGSVAGLDPTKTHRYLEQLGRIELDKSLWNYRFVDTLAYSYYLIAQREVDRVRHSLDPGEVENVRVKAFDILSKAYALYERARLYFGDDEIPSHLNDLNHLAAEIQFPISPNTPQRIGHESVPDRL